MEECHRQNPLPRKPQALQPLLGLDAELELEAVEDAAVVEEEAPPAVAARSSVKKPTLPHRKPSLAPHR